MNFNIFPLLTLISCLLLNTGVSSEKNSNPQQNDIIGVPRSLSKAHNDRKIVCYLPSWIQDFKLDKNLCTHIIYAFIGVMENGTLDYGKWNINTGHLSK